MGTERDYKRFYALLKKMPYADKATLVEQFTHGRTTHLHETSDGEYADMIAAMLKARRGRRLWLRQRSAEKSQEREPSFDAKAGHRHE